MNITLNKKNAPKNPISIKMYLYLADKVSAAELGDLISTMNDHDRLRLRLALELIDCKKMVHPLYYNYETQSWIELDRESPAWAQRY